MYDSMYEYTERWHYFQFDVNLDKGVGSCNVPNDLSNKYVFQTKQMIVSVFSIITGINKSKTLINNMSCKCKCKFDGRKCNSNQKWNYDKCGCEWKLHICEKYHIRNSATCSCKNIKYLANIIDNLVITCVKIIDAEAKSYDEETKTTTTNFN